MGNLHISGHSSLSRKLGCPHFWVSRGPWGGRSCPLTGAQSDRGGHPEGIQEEVGGKGKRLFGALDWGAPPSASLVRREIWGEEYEEEKETPCLGPELDLTELTLSGQGDIRTQPPGTRSISGEGNFRTQPPGPGAFLGDIPGPIPKSCRCSQWRRLPGVHSQV